VAVDSRVVTDGAGPHRVTQPVELPAGWELAGLGHPAAGGWVAASAAAAGGWAATGPVTAHTPASMTPRSAMPMRARSGHGRASRKAVTAAAMSASHGAPAEVSATGETSRLVQARRQAADEAAALRAAQGAADTERARLLADLATRIEALLAALTADPVATGLGGLGGLTGLGDLARELHACDGPGSPGGARLDALWRDAIRVLTDFAGDASPPASRAFWKRS
jgi:Ca-activated chloride channel homolog